MAKFIEKEVLIKKLNTYKDGTFTTIEWESDVSSARAKKKNIKITKRSKALVRLGCDYYNLQSTQNNGVVKGEGKPSWFAHCEDNKYLVKNKNNKNLYLQLFPVPGKKINTKFDSFGVDEINTNKLYEMGLINKSALPQQMEEKEEIPTIILNIEKIINFGV